MWFSRTKKGQEWKIKVPLKITYTSRIQKIHRSRKKQDEEYMCRREGVDEMDVRNSLEQACLLARLYTTGPKDVFRYKSAAVLPCITRLRGRRATQPVVVRELGRGMECCL